MELFVFLVFFTSTLLVMISSRDGNRPEPKPKSRSDFSQFVAQELCLPQITPELLSAQVGCSGVESLLGDVGPAGGSI